MTTLNQLRVYALARDFAAQCCRLARDLPQLERFTVGSQLIRAALSVKSNIAEGHGRRGSDLDFRRFLRDARGSLTEAFCQLELIQDLSLASPEAVSAALSDSRSLDRLLSAFIERVSPPARPQ